MFIYPHLYNDAYPGTGASLPVTPGRITDDILPLLEKLFPSHGWRFLKDACRKSISLQIARNKAYFVSLEESSFFAWKCSLLLFTTRHLTLW
jgi:hypothetical protein